MGAGGGPKSGGRQAWHLSDRSQRLGSDCACGRVTDFDPDLDLSPGPASYLEHISSEERVSLALEGQGERREQKLPAGGVPGSVDPRLALATQVLPSGVSPARPPIPHLACAPVGPRCLGCLPATPGRPLRPPGAGGVAAPRGPCGHAGDAGGGPAVAPRRRQRGPDLPEAPGSCPPQVRSCSASCKQPGAWPLGRLHPGGREQLVGRHTGTGPREGKPGCPHGPTGVPETLHGSRGAAFLFLVPHSHPLAKAFGTCSADLPQSVHAGHGVS